MKRDWDVIRQVLLEVEQLTEAQRHAHGYGIGGRGGDADPTKIEHALLLWRSGFIDAINATTNSGPAIISPALTWQGHELLDTIRSKPVWDRIKATAKDKGVELTFDVVKTLGRAALDYVLGGGS
ncbi:MAG: DUF2513 domain-containing protein [Burkholderiaceae bacterium]|nr:DUF2513 domain-containing protein [Burkholderiaceae bacterium]